MAAEPSWQQISRVVEAALDLPEREQQRFVAAACGDDAELRGQVEALLEAERQTEDFLELPAVSEAWESGSTPRIGPYRLLRELGRGGMSTVYLALRDDETYRQQVAIKVLREEAGSEDLLHRFHTERQILARLDHPNIGRLLDGGSTVTGRPYLVMEHIEGEPIDAYCEQHDLDLDRRIELFRRVCAAVQYAHQNLIVHRDLKPSNILVTAEGVPKLLDFGIAKLLAPSRADPTHPTETRRRVLTPQYASPEQIRGDAITTASDVYALGVLLYQLLARRLPYRLEHHTPAEAERLVCQQDPPWPSARALGETMGGDTMDGDPGPGDGEPAGKRRRSEPRQLARRLAGDLDHVVMKALRKEPDQRYASVEQLAEDLRRYQVALPVTARHGTLLYRTGRFLRRYRTGVAVAGAFLILILGFAITTAVQARRLAQERDRAQQERVTAQLERQRAERISSFLVELFELPDSEKSLGRSITARELLDRGASRLSRELEGEPRLRTELMASIGEVYVGLGHYTQSERLLREILEIQRQDLDSEPLEIARTLADLSAVLLAQGELSAAEATCRQALHLRRLHLPGERPELAQSLDQLGRIHTARGSYAAADRLLRQALDMRRRLLGFEHEDVVTSLHHLASNLLLRGDLEEGEGHLRRALDLARKIHGERASGVASISSDLAIFLGRTRRHAEASELLRTALEIYRETLAPDHPSIASVQTNLAGMLVELGRYEEAEPLAHSAVSLWRQILGPDYYGTAAALLLLGRIRFFAGRLDEADVFCRESLEVVRQQLGAQHPHSAHPLLWLGRIELARDRPELAEPLVREALAIWRNTLPDSHPFVAKAEGALGATLVAQGRGDEGVPRLEKSHRILSTAEGEEAEFTRWVSERLEGPR